LVRSTGEFGEAVRMVGSCEGDVFELAGMRVGGGRYFFSEEGHVVSSQGSMSCDICFH
jgi:hypothetical protein